MTKIKEEARILKSITLRVDEEASERCRVSSAQTKEVASTLE